MQNRWAAQFFFSQAAFHPFFLWAQVIFAWKSRLKQLWQLSVWGAQAEADESIKMDLGFGSESKSSKQDDIKCWSLCSVLLKEKINVLKISLFSYNPTGVRLCSDPAGNGCTLVPDPHHTRISWSSRGAPTQKWAWSPQDCGWCLKDSATMPRQLLCLWRQIKTQSFWCLQNKAEFFHAFTPSWTIYSKTSFAKQVQDPVEVLLTEHNSHTALGYHNLLSLTHPTPHSKHFTFAVLSPFSTFLPSA